VKIAFVHQPFGTALPPLQESIGIWIYEVARRVAASCEVLVYAKSRLWRKTRQHEGMQYRLLPTVPDRVWHTMLKPWCPRRGTTRPFFASRLHYVGYALQVAYDVRAQQCDVIHLHNFSQFVPILRAFNPRSKIVLHMHCEWLSQLDRSMVARRLSQVDLVIGCSDYITEKIRRRFPQFAGRCQTIRNGANVSDFTPENGSNRQQQNGTRRLLFVGRISPEKGLHVLLEALPEVIKYYPHVQLTIVGPKAAAPVEFIAALSDDETIANLAIFYHRNYHTHLYERLQALQITDYVTFTGSVPYARTVDHYGAADVVVQPSLSESSSLPVLEAMASGLPVVATRVGGIPESVEHEKTGFLVEPGNPLALARAILRLLTDDSLRRAMGKAARRRAVDLFSWERVADNVLHQYKSVLSDYHEA
jgi:glycosyltransferase involved in cell wall biosynthesis